MVKELAGQNGAAAVARVADPSTAAARTGMIFIGDSHTPAIQGGVDVARRSREGSASVFQNGSRLDQWAPGGALWPRLQNALANNPRDVVISLGTNDGIGGRSAADIRANVRQIVGAIRQSGAEPTWALPLHTTQHTAEVDAARTAIRAELQALGVRIVDVSNQNIPLRDGVHATIPAGYALWGRAVWQPLAERNASDR